jgi:hypothetical protein
MFCIGEEGGGEILPSFDVLFAQQPILERVITGAPYVLLLFFRGPRGII